MTLGSGVTVGVAIIVILVPNGVGVCVAVAMALGSGVTVGVAIAVIVVTNGVAVSVLIAVCVGVFSGGVTAYNLPVKIKPITNNNISVFLFILFPSLSDFIPLCLWHRNKSLIT